MREQCWYSCRLLSQALGWTLQPALPSVPALGWLHFVPWFPVLGPVLPNGEVANLQILPTKT